MAAKKMDEIVAYVQESIGLMMSLFHEKGWKYFKNPLLVGVGLTFLFYTALYSPANDSMKSIDSQIAAIRAQAQNASSFNSYKSQHLELEGKLPFLQTKADWLTSIVTQACAAENNLSPEKISPPNENDNGNTGSVMGSIQFDVTLDFKTLGQLISRLENNPLLVKVTDLSVSKSDRGIPGLLHANITLATIFPKTRVGAQAPPVVPKTPVAGK